MIKSIVATLLGCIALATTAQAQEIIPLQPCSNEQILFQADSLKKLMNGQGFIVLREASVSMESEFEQPVVVPMKGGDLYYFAFIGDQASRLFEVRMYDMEEKMVVYKKHKIDLDGNLIAFNYVPQDTQYHMFKPVQVSKQRKKGLCGYVLLFKKVSNTPITPAGN